MNMIRLTTVTFALVALAACGRSDEDQLNTTEINEMQSLDELSDDAANVADEAQALESQAANLEEEAEAAEDAQGPETPADENIAGM